jgi:hypothetical protein
MARNMKSLTEGTDFYYDAQGLMVLTATFLRERGNCCGNGCRHCPYDYQAVAEPRRSQLLAQRQQYGNSAEEK